jgi:hypothetical protein
VTTACALYGNKTTCNYCETTAMLDIASATCATNCAYDRYKCKVPAANAGGGSFACLQSSEKTHALGALYSEDCAATLGDTIPECGIYGISGICNECRDSKMLQISGNNTCGDSCAKTNHICENANNSTRACLSTAQMPDYNS